MLPLKPESVSLKTEQESTNPTEHISRRFSEDIAMDLLQLAV